MGSAVKPGDGRRPASSAILTCAPDDSPAGRGLPAPSGSRPTPPSLPIDIPREGRPALAAHTHQRRREHPDAPLFTTRLDPARPPAGTGGGRKTTAQIDALVCTALDRLGLPGLHAAGVGEPADIWLSRQVLSLLADRPDVHMFPTGAPLLADAAKAIR